MNARVEFKSTDFWVKVVGIIQQNWAIIEDDAAKTASAPVSSTANRGGGQTILVVENDERVLRLAVTRLEEVGYRVQEANNGVSALEILRSGTPIDLVFTDLIMPCGVSGLELARKARAINPVVKVLISSCPPDEIG